MGKKGKKTRWRRLPIGGTDEESGLNLETTPSTDSSRITFNEDEYTKITTPRQDVLFKKGYFGRKRTPNPSPSDTQEAHSGDSVESESYVSEDPQCVYPTGYMDPTGVYYVNGNTYEMYDPYTGMVTVVVGPPQQYPGGAPVLAALPCQPVPLQPVEWFSPPAPWSYSSYNHKKRYSTDSQNCSAQSSESTGPPGSPQEPVEEGACAPPLYPPQYVYPGYMFGPPIYNVNGMTMQGVVPQPIPLPQDLLASKRRKKRRRRRRGGVTEDGSESSCCEEPLTCDVTGCQSETGSDAVCRSGASSDGGVSSKANSDSGINTDPTPNSGSNSPPLLAQAPFHPSEHQLSVDCVSYQEQVLPVNISSENVQEDSSLTEVTTPEEVTEELSTAEDDVTPNLCAAVPEFSSQESTLSCLSTPSATKEFVVNEIEVSNADVSETFQSLSEPVISQNENHLEVLLSNELEDQSSLSAEFNSAASENYLNNTLEKNNDSNESMAEESESIINNLGIEVKEHCGGDVHINEETQIKTKDDLEIINPVKIVETLISSEEYEEEAKVPSNSEEQLRIAVTEPECGALSSTNVETVSISENEQSFSRFSSCRESIAPVPPPRRKRSLSRAADKIASRIVEEAINEGIEEACERLRSPLSITEAVTRWLNSHESSPLTHPILDSESSSDDEGIEVEDGLTDQKNVRGNPFPVSSHSGTGQRVAKDCESLESSAGEWDMWDHNHTRDMCDPTRSVEKYYRLGADDSPLERDKDKVPPTVYKTAMHIHHTGPFPCGVCCIIQ